MFSHSKTKKTISIKEAELIIKGEHLIKKSLKLSSKKKQFKKHNQSSEEKPGGNFQETEPNETLVAVF